MAQAFYLVPLQSLAGVTSSLCVCLSYPALRSYSLTRGFDPREPRTLNGTVLALSSLRDMEGVTESFTAPCSFGSPYQKGSGSLTREWVCLSFVALALVIISASESKVSI